MRTAGVGIFMNSLISIEWPIEIKHSDFLRENNYTGKIVGIFWAKAVLGFYGKINYFSKSTILKIQTRSV